jgi:hypothetical protein
MGAKLYSDCLLRLTLRLSFLFHLLLFENLVNLLNQLKQALRVLLDGRLSAKLSPFFGVSHRTSGVRCSAPNLRFRPVLHTLAPIPCKPEGAR